MSINVSRETMIKLVDTCKDNQEMRQYLFKQFQEIVKKQSNEGDYNDLLGYLEILATKADALSGNAWVNELFEKDEQMLDIEANAAVASQSLAKTDNQQIKFIYAINDASELQWSQDIEDRTKKLFHAWLLQNKMIMTEDKICDVDDRNKVVDRAKFEAAINDEKTGFLAYIKERNNNSEVTILKTSYIEPSSNSEPLSRQ